MRGHALLGCFFLMLLWNSGCASNPPKKASPTVTVKGTVNMNGAPMKEGEIRFSVPGEPVTTIPIVNGTFSGNASAGKNTVEVYLFKDGPPRSTDPNGPPTKVNTIPEEFSGTNTTLRADVTAGGPNDFKFDITR